MATSNDQQCLTSVILALCPELALAQGEDRQKRLRAAAAMIRGVDDISQRRLISVVCAVMRISTTVFRQILSE